ncbi:hypothetical protein B0H16DRAFT_649925 [Mycena metata]|uniref:Uncharacterized protein n=1 Tax=Mycena metata TaxID=1033252 RepID=A0AAD7J9B5_9AGAR|nr:hypothetical protein B0H16DRAFT_649925 [Mycena metata]
MPSSSPMPTSAHSQLLLSRPTQRRPWPSHLCVSYISTYSTKNRRFSAFLVFTVALHLSFSYTSAVMLNFVKLEADKIVLTAWIAFFSCAATDTMIAVALLSTFIRMNTATAMRDSTHRWVD